MNSMDRRTNLLMKQVLEGAEITRSTQQHLDRCLPV